MTERDNTTGAPALARVWLTPREVQERTGYSRTTVFEALWSGELEGHQRGKHHQWRVHIDAVDAWIRGQTQKKAS